VKLERRVIALPDAGLGLPELRAKGDGGGNRFSGHAAVYDSLSVELFGFYERIAPSAFQDAIDGKNDVRFLINHDSNLVLARNKFGEGTLDLASYDVGLLAEADFPATDYADNIAESLRRGDVDQMSFGFRTLEDSWNEEELQLEDGGSITVPVRTVERVELLDVSVVTFPAYPETDAGLRYLGLTGGALVVTERVGVATTADDSELKRVVEGLRELEERKGKVLSQKNQDAIVAAVDALKGVLEAASSDEDEEQNSHDSERERARIRALELSLPEAAASIR
jgi:HK97 family phage prohead protease